MPVNIVAANADDAGDRRGPFGYPLWETIVESHTYPVCPSCGHEHRIHDPTCELYQCQRCKAPFIAEREVEVVYRCRSCHNDLRPASSN